jgi:hypothetical protein
LRLELPAIRYLAASCRLLQYGQSATQAFTPIEDALRLRSERRGWSIPRPLPVKASEAVNCFLRLAWQDGLEFYCMATAPETHLSLFVNTSDGKLRGCGVEGQYWGHWAGYDRTLGFGRDGDRAEDLGYGWDRGWEQFVIPEPIVVPSTAGLRMRSVAAGWMHCLALTEDGEVYTWTGAEARGPVLPELLQELREHHVRKIAAGRMHSAAITDRGELFTWWDQVDHSQQPGGDGVGYFDDDDRTCRSPRRVAAFNGMRIISVAAGRGCTIAVTDTGVWRCPEASDRAACVNRRPVAFGPRRCPSAGLSFHALHSLTLLLLPVPCRPRLLFWGCNIRMPRARRQPAGDRPQGD